MIGALLVRDLTLIARRRGLVAAVLAHAAIASAFMLAWSGERRVPLLTGANLYEQLAVLQWAFMCVGAPWIAARLTADERRTELVRLSALTGAPPARVVGVRLLALALWSLAAVVAAWPAVLLATEMSGVTFAAFAVDQFLLLGFAFCAAVLTLHVELTIDGRMASWMSATAVSVLLAWIVSGAGPGAPIVTLTATVIAIWRLVQRADAMLWHLAEPRG